MNTNRFETFYDAVLAIVITILVLKIPQPLGPQWGAFISNYLNITTYFIVFLAIINIWYSNHNLFQHIGFINNKLALNIKLHITIPPIIYRITKPSIKSLWAELGAI